MKESRNPLFSKSLTKKVKTYVTQTALEMRAVANVITFSSYVAEKSIVCTDLAALSTKLNKTLVDKRYKITINTNLLINSDREILMSLRTNHYIRLVKYKASNLRRIKRAILLKIVDYFTRSTNYDLLGDRAGC